MRYNEIISESIAEDFEEEFDALFQASSYASISHVNINCFGEKDAEISHIGVDLDHRGKGIGNALMQMITSLADGRGVILYASPATDADEEEGPGYERLREWYESWDFEKISGRDLMKREPDNS